MQASIAASLTPAMMTSGEKRVLLCIRFRYNMGWLLDRIEAGACAGSPKRQLNRTNRYCMENSVCCVATSYAIR
jgi:hypothetical protein